MMHLPPDYVRLLMKLTEVGIIFVGLVLIAGMLV